MSVKEIERVLHRYAWGIDGGDADLVASCFAVDGSMTSVNGTVSGRESLRADVDEKREVRAARGIVHHFISNVEVISEDGVAADVRSLFAATVHNDGATTIFASGWYEDRFVKEDGSWVIARRLIHLDGR